MPRTKKQFEEMRQATKDKIQNAAIRLFSQKGVAGTNVQEIADCAGISIGLLYRHYKTKDDLFNDLVQMATAGLENLIKSLSTESDPKELLSALTTEVINDYKRNDEFSSYMTFITQVLTSGMKSDALESLIETDKHLIATLAALIKKGQNNGSFRYGDPKELACSYMSLIQGIGLFQNVMGTDFFVPSVNTLLNLFL